VIQTKLSLLALASLLLVASSGPAAAQPKGDAFGVGVGGPGPGRPLFLEHLYRPEVIMRNQGALALTQEQRAGIAASIKSAQERLSPLQWDLEARSEALAKLVEPDKVDVEKVLATATETIEIEGKIKREHLRLMLEIKNQLTPEQIAKLRNLRPERGGGPGDRGRRGGPPPPPPPPADDEEPPA